MAKCKWCNTTFDLNNKSKFWMASHTRWCDYNPNKEHYLKTLKENGNVKLMNEAKRISGNTNQYAKAKLNGYTISNPLKGTKRKGTKHTKETKELLRQKALASKHRRLKKNTIKYKGITLDSNWELELAKRLDELKIKWIRPAPIPWVDDNGLTHNYFPDFYLEDYNLYLDPKNPAAFNSQRKKIEVLKETYNNIIFITSIDDCKTFSL